MLKRFLIAAMLWLAGCQSAAPTETLILPTLTPVPPTETPLPATPTSSHWVETEVNGVSLGIWSPEGWDSDLSDGLVLAEHLVAPHTEGAGGMLIYCFVPPVDEFNLQPNDENYAWTILKQVVKMPSHTGRDVAMSDPEGFTWEVFPAGYYLLSTGDGVRALVLAVALPGRMKVVVCNVSVPAAQSARIRAALPQLLNGFTVDGTALHGKALESLPDPLPFPRYSLSATMIENPVSANAKP
jgi:hypothetical protein